MEQILILDLETRSEAELKKVGAWEYSLDLSTQILCVAYRLAARDELHRTQTKSWKAYQRDEMPADFRDALKDPNIRIVAHNAGFENAILRHVLKIEIPLSRWVCTAAMAASHALPRSLEGACIALDLTAKKDPKGALLIRRHCKPRKPTIKDRSRWNDDKAGLNDLTEYCMRDVDAGCELFLALPELHPREKEVWKLDQLINLRGVFVDRPLVKTILAIADREKDSLDHETFLITDGALNTTRRRHELKQYLWAGGLEIPNLRKEVVAAGIDPKSRYVKGVQRRLLEIRQAVSRTSTAKYESFEMRTRSDSRLRDILIYHGATTGRWAGAGVQVQNFPRGSVKDMDGLCDTLATGDLEWIRCMYGDPMKAFSDGLRGMITATPGFDLYVSDYSSIEVRVLFWLAGHTAGLKAYEEKRDIYREMACKIYNVKLDEITPEMREIGKRAILGLGYGMGVPKFLETCKAAGMEMSQTLASKAVRAYRTAHHPVQDYWKRTELSALHAVDSGERIAVGRCTWFREGRFLYCELPSGRRLSYPDPKPIIANYPNGVDRQLEFAQMNPYTRKWERGRTYGARLVENVTQAVARDLMSEACLRLESKGYQILMTVHDEVIAEKQKGDLSEYLSLMLEKPEWAKGLPIQATGFKGYRYRK